MNFWKKLFGANSPKPTNVPESKPPQPPPSSRPPQASPPADKRDPVKEKVNERLSQHPLFSALDPALADALSHVLAEREKSNPTTLEGAASLAETVAAGNKATDGSGLPPCDICSCGITPETTYLLSTSQVVASEDYWEWLIRSEASPDSDGDNVAMRATMLGNMVTAWSVCERCIHLFQVDRDAAKSFSRNKQNPPSLGPANQTVACMAAAYGFSRIHNQWPKSVQVGSTPITHDERAGTKCSFCCRITTEKDAAIGMVPQVQLPEFESRARVKHRSSPALIRDGTSFWIACSKCLDRFSDRDDHLLYTNVAERALQRTASGVTACGLLSPPPPPAVQPARQPPQSLSLESLGL